MALSSGCRAILIGCRAVLKECVSRHFVEHSQRDYGALLRGCRSLFKASRALLSGCRALLKVYTSRK